MLPPVEIICCSNIIARRLRRGRQIGQRYNDNFIKEGYVRTCELSFCDWERVQLFVCLFGVLVYINSRETENYVAVRPTQPYVAK